MAWISGFIPSVLIAVFLTCYYLMLDLLPLNFLKSISSSMSLPTRRSSLCFFWVIVPSPRAKFSMSMSWSSLSFCDIGIKGSPSSPTCWLLSDYFESWPRLIFLDISSLNLQLTRILHSWGVLKVRYIHGFSNSFECFGSDEPYITIHVGFMKLPIFIELFGSLASWEM